MLKELCTHLPKFCAHKPVAPSASNKLARAGHMMAGGVISSRMFLTTVANSFSAFIYLTTIDDSTNWYLYGASLLTAGFVFSAYFFSLLKNKQFYSSPVTYFLSRASKSFRFGLNALTAVVNFNVIISKAKESELISKNNLILGIGLLFATAIKLIYLYETLIQTSDNAYKFRAELLETTQTLQSALRQTSLDTDAISRTINRISVLLTQLLDTFQTNPHYYQLSAEELKVLLVQVDQIKIKLMTCIKPLSSQEASQLCLLVENLKQSLEKKPTKDLEEAASASAAEGTSDAALATSQLGENAPLLYSLTPRPSTAS